MITKYFKKEFNKEKFISGNYVKETKYGLSATVKFCKICLMSNQRPNMTAEHYHTIDTAKDTIKFYDDVCYACKLREKKKEIDWKEREFNLIKLLEKYKSRNGSYDVVCPGSGGKDSFYVAHKLKYKYGMHPITCTFAPNMYTKWGWDNFQNWINAGFSNYLFTCNAKIHRFITRLSLESLLHPFQPWILGQKGYPTKFAAKMGIPLIFYGENPAEYEGKKSGDPNSSYHDDMQLEWFACENINDVKIAGIEFKVLNKDYNLKINELEPYTPLTVSEFKKNKLKCVSFSYFENWHPQNNYYYTVENSDFKPSPERTSGTYSKYASIDDKIDDLHYYTSHIKFGIGRTHQDVAQEIRSGDVTTEEGMSLIKKFDGEYPRRFLNDILEHLSIDKKKFGFLSDFFEVSNIDKDYFDNLCDNFRSPHLWKFTNQGWKLRHTPYKKQNEI